MCRCCHGKTTQPNWCLSLSCSYRSCGKLSVFRNSRASKEAEKSLFVCIVWRKDVENHLPARKYELRRLIVEGRTAAGLSGESTNRADLWRRCISVDRTAALWRSGTSPTTMWHVCVYASLCAALHTLPPTQHPARQKISVPEQKHEGSSHQKTSCRQSSDNLFTCITAKCLICIYPLSYFLIRIRRLKVFICLRCRGKSLSGVLLSCRREQVSLNLLRQKGE